MSLYGRRDMKLDRQTLEEGDQPVIYTKVDLMSVELVLFYIFAAIAVVSAHSSSSR